MTRCSRFFEFFLVFPFRADLEMSSDVDTPKMDVDTKKTSISSRRHENLGDEGSYATSLGSVALAEERTSPW